MREILAVIFLSIFSSKLLWYDFRTFLLSERLEVLQSFFLIYSIFLLPFILFLVVSQLNSLRKNFFILCFFILCFYGIIMGVAFGNVNRYLFQDIYKFLFFPSGFALAVYLRRHECSFERVISATLLVMILYAFLRVFVHLYFKKHGLIFGTNLDILIISYAVTELFSVPSFRSFFVSLLTIPAILLGQKRTLLVVLFLVFGLLYLDLYRNKKIKKILVFSLSLFLLVLLFVSCANFFSPISENMFKRYSGTVNTVSSDVGTESKRFREILVALKNMENFDPLAFMTGFGSGAFFVDPVDNVVTGKVLVHSIHFTPMALVYRYGFWGVLFYVLIISYVFYLVYKSRNGVIGLDYKYYQVMALYLIGNFVMSFIVYGFFDDIFVGFFTGVLSLSLKYRRGKIMRPPIESLPRLSGGAKL